MPLRCDYCSFHICHCSPKKVTYIFAIVTGSPTITGCLWIVRDHEPGLSSKYGDVSFTLQFWKMPSKTAIKVAPLNFSFQTLNGMELVNNLQHCSHTLTLYKLTVVVSGTSWASCCVFRPLSSAGERSCWRFSAPLRHGQTSVGEGEVWVRGRQEHFSFGQAKYSVGIM